jgi:Bacteriocin-protection, YdeI or OmpD-Associated/Domain of unknown function (DUF1905)
MRFRTVIELHGKTATGMAVPDEVVTALGPSRRPAVTVTVGEVTYRSTISAMGGRFLLPLSADRRAASGYSAGDEVDVEVELDTAQRQVVVPDDLAAALRADPAVQARFDALSYTRRAEYARAVESAKAAQTRARRVAKAVAELSTD